MSPVAPIYLSSSLTPYHQTGSVNTVSQNSSRSMIPLPQPVALSSLHLNPFENQGSTSQSRRNTSTSGDPVPPQVSAPSPLQPGLKAFEFRYETHDGEHRNLDPMEEEAPTEAMLDEESLSNCASKKNAAWKDVQEIPVLLKSGKTCRQWKGYAVIDELDPDAQRELTCLVEINEWVHLVDGKIKLYDKYNVYNGELTREEYVLYRKDPAKFAQLGKLLGGRPVPRKPCVDTRRKTRLEDGGEPYLDGSSGPRSEGSKPCQEDSGKPRSVANGKPRSVANGKPRSVANGKAGRKPCSEARRKSRSDQV